MFFFLVEKKSIFETERLIPKYMNTVQTLGFISWSSLNFPYKQITEAEYILSRGFGDIGLISYVS